MMYWNLPLNPLLMQANESTFDRNLTPLTPLTMFCSSHESHKSHEQTFPNSTLLLQELEIFEKKVRLLEATFVPYFYISIVHPASGRSTLRFCLPTDINLAPLKSLSDILSLSTINLPSQTSKQKPHQPCHPSQHPNKPGGRSPPSTKSTRHHLWTPTAMDSVTSQA